MGPQKGFLDRITGLTRFFKRIQRGNEHEKPITKARRDESTKKSKIKSRLHFGGDVFLAQDVIASENQSK
jgi:hypothetical protein